MSLSLATAAPLPAAPLTLGKPTLPEHRTVSPLLPGVTLTTIRRGQMVSEPSWTVNVSAVSTRQDGEKLLNDLKAAGFEGRLDPMHTQGVIPGELGFMVRVGRFFARAQAEATLADLKAKNFGGGVQNLLEDGGTTEGPWHIQVLSIEPSAQATVRAALASDLVPGRETTSALARRLGAVAAVNGGFFVVNSSMGSEGDLAGISVINGELVSEAVNGRPALLIDRNRLSGRIVQGVTSSLTVTAGTAHREASGLNRKPGLIFNCGNAAASPTSKPAHDYVCGSDSEMIVFTRAFGEASDEGAGYEVSVDPHGTVTAVQGKRGMPVPNGGMTVQATGDSAKWLAEHARVGQKLSVSYRVRDGQGNELPLQAGLDMVNGGPTLLAAGQPVQNYAAEGWSPEALPGSAAAASAASRLNFFNGWVLRRNPRTAVGTMQDGTLLFVTVDGRNPTHSVGASIPEMAALMRDLGAVDAMNLDGGGSTAIYANGMLQGISSDASGERPDGDAIVIFSRP